MKGRSLDHLASFSLRPAGGVAPVCPELYGAPRLLSLFVQKKQQKLIKSLRLSLLSVIDLFCLLIFISAREVTRPFFGGGVSSSS